MARYTGPAYKKARRVGFSIGETGKELARRPYGPGQHGQDRKGKLSDYVYNTTVGETSRWVYKGKSPNNHARIDGDDYIIVSFSEQDIDDNERLETMDDCHAAHSRHRLTGTDKAFG